MPPVEYFEVDAVAPPGGHYSHAAGYGDMIFISGQLPVPRDGIHEPGASFEDQAKRVMRALTHVLHAAGSDASHVLRVTAYIVGVENWGSFNSIYAESFGNARPARAIVPVPSLHHGYLLEVDAVAVRAANQA